MNNPVEWLESNAPDPWRARDAGTTPDEAYRDILRNFQATGLMYQAALEQLLPDPSGDFGAWPYLDTFAHMAHRFDAVLLLRELHALSPDAAREAAYKLWLAYEVGGDFGEWLWRWCQEDGLNPDEIVALSGAVAAAAIARLRCREHSND